MFISMGWLVVLYVFAAIGLLGILGCVVLFLMGMYVSEYGPRKMPLEVRAKGDDLKEDRWW